MSELCHSVHDGYYCVKNRGHHGEHVAGLSEGSRLNGIRWSEEAMNLREELTALIDKATCSKCACGILKDENGFHVYDKSDRRPCNSQTATLLPLIESRV